MTIDRDLSKIILPMPHIMTKTSSKLFQYNGNVNKPLQKRHNYINLLKVDEAKLTRERVIEAPVMTLS